MHVYVVYTLRGVIPASCDDLQVHVVVVLAQKVACPGMMLLLRRRAITQVLVPWYVYEYVRVRVPSS